MQHQYWVTKKTILKKFGGKEDECVVASDAELDAKLELFKSISEGCIQLQRVLELYQDKICNVAKEENALGRYLKEVAKSERNKNAAELMTMSGKAIAYISHQKLPIRSSLVRFHHEVETFRGRAVSDTRYTAAEMEKIRTEYRAALTWMKAASSELDPDSCQSLERFRKAQSKVRSSKARFDHLKLACLQKVDLLAAARCNMFSHALVPYQNAVSTFHSRAAETLCQTAECLEKAQAGCLVEPKISLDADTDKDQKLFFDEYKDEKPEEKSSDINDNAKKDDDSSTSLLCDLEETPDQSSSNDADLLSLAWPAPSASDNAEDLLGDALSSPFQQFLLPQKTASASSSPSRPSSAAARADKNPAIQSWLNIFQDLDPLANADFVTKTQSSDCA